MLMPKSISLSNYVVASAVAVAFARIVIVAISRSLCS